MEYKVVIKSKKRFFEHTNCPVNNNLATYNQQCLLIQLSNGFFFCRTNNQTKKLKNPFVRSFVSHSTLKAVPRPHLSRWATTFEGAEDAAGDEGEAEEGEHDDGADAQLRDRLLRLLLPPPQPSLGVLLLPVVDCH